MSKERKPKGNELQEYHTALTCFFPSGISELSLHRTNTLVGPLDYFLSQIINDISQFTRTHGQRLQYAIVFHPPPPSHPFVDLGTQWGVMAETETTMSCRPPLSSRALGSGCRQTGLNHPHQQEAVTILLLVDSRVALSSDLKR